MVQILPPKTNLGSSLGQALGQGLQTGLERGINRGQLQNALQDVRGLANQPGANAFDLASSLMSATAGIPGAERYVGQLFPLLLSNLQGQKASQIPPPGGAAPAMGKTQPDNQPQTQPQQVQEQSLPIPLPEPSVIPYGGALEETALGMGPIPKTYSPEEYQQVTQAYQAQGLDPTPAIAQMQQRDTAARNQIEDQIKGAETHARISQLKTNRQQEFRTILKEQIPNINDKDLAVLETISLKPEHRKIQNDKLRAEAAAKDFRLYETARSNFEKVSGRQNYDKTAHDKQIKELGNYAKILMENGQLDEAIKILAQNGWGPTEISQILNPIGKNVFEKLPKLKPIEESIRAFPEETEGEFERQFEAAQNKRNNEIEKYKEKLASEISPGTSVKPGTSLLQLRQQFLKNGGSWQEFQTLINDLVNSRQIKLDSYQDSVEKPLLAEDPIRSMGIGELIWRFNPTYLPRE